MEWGVFDGKGDVLRAPSELTGASVTNSVVPEAAIVACARAGRDA